MPGKIVKWKLIALYSIEMFSNAVEEYIDKLQKENLEVEIHYAISDGYFSAMIIGKEKTQ